MSEYYINNKGNYEELYSFIKDYLKEKDIPVVRGSAIFKEKSENCIGLLFFVGVGRPEDIKLSKEGRLIRRTKVEISETMKTEIKDRLKSGLEDYARENNYDIE